MVGIIGFLEEVCCWDKEWDGCDVVVLKVELELEFSKDCTTGGNVDIDKGAVGVCWGLE